VDGTSSVPTPALISNNGLPSVDATAIPPWFAVVSFEITAPPAVVARPTIISLSLTVNVDAAIRTDVPPIVTLPPT